MNVPEVFSDEEQESSLSPEEMKDVVKRALQGSFLPIMAVLETQEENLDPDMVIDAERGLTLLHSAAYYGKIKPMRALVERFHADKRAQDYQGQTPLHIATLAGNLEACVYLTEKLRKHDVQAKDYNLMTALMNCVVSNSEHAFIYLYFKGKSNLSHVDSNGNTLLHLAAEHNATNIARILKHLFEIEVKEEIFNSSIEKINQIRTHSIALH